MTQFVNNNVSSGAVVYASDHNTQGALLAALLNGNIDNDNISPTAAIALSKLASTAWTSWTPTWTNVTIGNAVVVGSYIQVGKLVIARLSVVWGNTTSASGNTRFSLPVTAATYAGTANVGYIGYGTMYDVTGALVYDTNLTLTSTTVAGIVAKAANGTWVTNATVTHASPVTWADTDEWNWTLIYEKA